MYENEKEGDRIPGSRFYRHFCPRCQTPMRACYNRIGDPSLWCNECSPPHKGVGTGLLVADVDSNRKAVDPQGHFKP